MSTVNVLYWICKHVRRMCKEYRKWLEVLKIEITENSQQCNQRVHVDEWCGNAQGVSGTIGTREVTIESWR